jgi:hypothetical protein
MYEFLYETVIDQKSTTFDEAKSASNKTPIDFESMDPLEVDDLRDGVFNDTRYLTERERW